MFVPECAEDEDEGPTEKFDLVLFGDLGCEPDCPPPPGVDPPIFPFADWDYHSGTDTYYRYASETELEVHDWVAGTILMSTNTNVDALTNGSNSLTLGVPVGNPTGGITVEAIAISKAQTRNDAWYLTVEDAVVGPVAHAFRPDFHLFLPSWVDFEALSRPMGTDVFVWVYGDSHGGVAIRGMTADQEFSILGPTTGVWLETLPPDDAGVLVATPTFHTTGFDDILDHWIEVFTAFCDGADCDLEPDIPVDPGNCGDCIDNDQDSDLDTDDLFCKHRSDFGCDGFGDHNHRWENSKDFAMMPDIEWCTKMKVNGMPWQAEINMNAMTAAGLINAIPMALEWMHDQELEEAIETPDDLAIIRHRLSYCVFADDVEVAFDCIDDDGECPSFYQLGGVTHADDASDAYFQKLWAEFDVATAMLEDEDVTPRPVAMLSSVYSGNLPDPIEGALVIGETGTIGEIQWEKPFLLGSTMIESKYFYYTTVAHELGHALGLSHTTAIEIGTDEYTGFMGGTSSLSVLGPSVNVADGYGGSNQWFNWSVRIGDKTIPRPNAFAWTGCDHDNDCPTGQLECRIDTGETLGLCHWPL